MSILTKESILSADDLTMEEVEIPEWGGSVWVKALTGTQRDKYEQSMLDMRRVGQKTVVKPTMTNAKAQLAVQCVVDEAGVRLFDNNDARALGDKSACALNTIADVAMRLSGMTEQDLKDLEGNSETAPDDDSTSD